MKTLGKALLQWCMFAGLAVTGASGYAAENSGLEEVVVTAERRQESLQDVPLSITAFSSEVRDRIGITSIQDMANFAPGVSYNTATDRPSIRGIGRTSNIFSLDSPVANYYDGVYTSSVQDAQRRPIFIERTEVLRGPQGALSGRGSIGGAINTISKRPRDAFGGEMRTTLGDYERYVVEATLTGPLTDWLRTRINVGMTRQEEGYFNNVATHGTEGDQPNNRESIDFLFEADLSENVDLFVKVALSDYEETRRTLVTTAPYVAGVQNDPTAYGPSSGTLVPLASFGYFPGSNGRALSGYTQNPVLVNGDLRDFASTLESNQRLDDQHNYTAHLTWHAPTADAKWIGGHSNYQYTQWIEPRGNGGDVLTMDLPAPFPGAARRTVSPGGRSLYQEEREWYSNEFTVTSTNDSALQWIAGLYQSNEQYSQQPESTFYDGYDELNNPYGIGQLGDLTDALFTPPAAPIVPLVAANPVAHRSQFGFLDGETISTAAFGQVAYAFTDAWKVTVGLRYNRDEKEVTEMTRYIANGLGNTFGGLLAGGGLASVTGGPVAVDVTPAPIPGTPLPPGVVRDRGIDPATGYRVRDLKNSWNAYTGSAGVDFTPTSDNLIFLRYARGYRPGGFDAGFIADTPQVDKESVDSYELGYKTTLARQLQLSASAFYYNYSNSQQPLSVLGRCTDPSDLSTCQSVNSFVNMRSSASRGVELETNWAASEALGFYFTYGYLRAKVKDALTGTNGFLNPDDPAAVLPSAKRYALVGNQADTGYTFLPLYTQDVSGNSLANSPQHRLALNGNYTMQFVPGSLTFSSNYVWRSSQFSDVFETAASKTPSFHTVDARLTWNGASERYTVMLYGTNLTNENAADGALLTRQRTGLATAASPGVNGAAYYRLLNLLPPRQWGLEMQYRFGSDYK